MSLRRRAFLEGCGGLVLGWLAGCGDAPQSLEALRAEPSRLELGAVLVGQARTHPLQLLNETGGPVFVDRMVPDAALDRAIQLVGEPAVLAPDQPTDVEVVFLPTRAGRWEGDLRIDFDRTEGRSPLIIPLGGSGVEGELETSPPELDFGRVRVGQAVTATVVIHNRGPVTVTVLALPFAPGSSPAFSARLASVVQLAPGAAQPVSVRFAPQEAGRVSATLLGAGEDRMPLGLEVPLSGEGADSDLEVSPQQIEIRGVFVGEVGRRWIRVRNLSFAPRTARWTLSSSVSAEAFRLEGPGSALLEPGESADVELQFAPREAGASEGVISFFGPDEVLRVSVSGTAEAPFGPRPRLDPETLRFGPVSLGHITQRWVRVTLEGDAPLSDGARFEILPSPTRFAWSESWVEMDPGDHRRLAVRFAPIAAGPVTAVLWVGTASRAVSAEGVAGPTSELEAWPPEIDFGRVPREVTARRTLRLESRGAVAAEGLTAVLEGPFELVDAVSSTWPPGQEGDVRLRLVDDGGAPGPRTGRLRLRSSSGPPIEVPLRAELRALPSPLPQVEVSLRWAGAANLDLHLSLDGADIFDAPRSVCFCHPQADWGELGGEDDPWLDGDARSTLGVETIRIDVARASRYRIDVTHRAGAPVTAEVEVRVLGVVVGRTLRLLSEHHRWFLGALALNGTRASLEIDPRPLERETRAECD